jgi:hypothetical protein
VNTARSFTKTVPFFCLRTGKKWDFCVEGVEKREGKKCLKSLPIRVRVRVRERCILTVKTRRWLEMETLDSQPDS